MEPIYVTGHRNPDTDSIVSAIAYAALRCALGHREYVAARLGHLSDETKAILQRFNYPAPVFIKTVRTQIRDLDYDTPPALHQAVTVERGWEALKSGIQISSVPITDEDGGLFGMLSPGDIAAYEMQVFSEPYLTNIPVFNLISVLEGQLVGETGYGVDSVSGELLAALPDPPLTIGRDSIVLCGNSQQARQALEARTKCLILCQTQLPDDIPEIEEGTCIISTPFDVVRASRLVFHAIPVARICRTKELSSIHLDDFVDDVRELVIQSRYRSYPILDENDRVVGTLSRYHLLRPRRKRVVLVDHNEAAQSVPGLDQAEVLEIIDHHRLADIQTTAPISFRNEPVGSTATIVAQMYQEKGLMPSPQLAGLMAAAILSDTVLFQSPTCTDRDRRMAERLARLAQLSLQELGQEIFSVTDLDTKNARDLLLTDFKEFRIAGHELAVSQITCANGTRLLERKDEFFGAMENLMSQKGYAYLILMVTDVLASGSHLLCLGDEDTLRMAFGTELKDKMCFLPGVLSRKKQIIPMLSALWG